MDLAVAFGWREREQILRVQLVGDALERGAEILSEPDLEIAAAGLFGDARETRVGQVGDEHGLQPARPQAPRGWGPVAAAAQADGVDHHVLEARAVDDVRLARRALAEARRTAVLAVAQHQNHLAAAVVLAERAHRLLERPPQRRR